MQLIYLFIKDPQNKNSQNKFMSHTTIKWVLRAKNIYIDYRRFNTSGTTSPAYINSFLVSRYLFKNLPNFFKVDTEVGLFKDSSVKPLSPFGNNMPDGYVSLLPQTKRTFQNMSILVFEVSLNVKHASFRFKYQFCLLWWRLLR